MHLHQLFLPQSDVRYDNFRGTGTHAERVARQGLAQLRAHCATGT